jgi:hypothetical protein
MHLMLLIAGLDGLGVNENEERQFITTPLEDV